MTQKRQSNIELLRIIAMLFIVLHHLIINGIDYSTAIKMNPCDWNCILGGILEPFCIIGVNLFFLISGYFLIRFSWKKCAYIVIKLYMYFFIIRMLGVFIGFCDLNMETIEYIIWPLGSYWFLRVYILLMFVSPVLNLVINQMNVNMSRYFILFFAFFVCGYSFFINDIHLGFNRGYSFLFACCLYLLGAIARKGLIFVKINKSRQWIILWAAALLCNVVLTEFSLIGLEKGNLAAVLQVYNSPLIVTESFCFFMAFVYMKIDETTLKATRIKKISRGILDVYILHSSNKVIPYYRNIPLKMIAEHSIWSAYCFVIPYAVIVFAFCIMIAMIFDNTLGRLVDKLSDHIGNFLEKTQKIISV